MPSNLNFDDKLLDEACKLGGFKDKKDAVNAALKEFINKRKRESLLELFNQIEYYSDYDYKKAR